MVFIAAGFVGYKQFSSNSSAANLVVKSEFDAGSEASTEITSVESISRDKDKTKPREIQLPEMRSLDSTVQDITTITPPVPEKNSKIKLIEKRAEAEVLEEKNYVTEKIINEKEDKVIPVFNRMEHSPDFRVDFEDVVVPFFQKHCVSCHGPKKEKGGLRVDHLVANLNDDYTLDHLQNIIDEMTVENMPPEEEPQPSSKDIVAVINVLNGLVEAAKERHSAGGGRPVRRLTRSEFINTIWDLLGVHIDEGLLPNDLLLGSFENNAETLFLTDMHISLYLDKARDAVRRFIASRDREPGFHEIPVKYSPLLMQSQFAFDTSDVPPAGYLMVKSKWWLNNFRDKNQVFVGPSGEDNEYAMIGTKKSPQIVNFKIWDQSGDIPWEIKKSNTPSKKLNEGLTKREAALRIKALGDYQLNEKTLIKAQKRIRHHPVVLSEIEHIQVVNNQPYKFFAPFLKKGDRLPESAASDIIRKFVRLVKRGRPADSAYVEKLTKVFKRGRRQGMSFWEALEEPMAFSLCSIDSILHFEDRAASKSSKSISGVEFANRLSYTLWRSAPDGELVRLGRSGDLFNVEVKAQQIKRMMEDEKFDRFLTDFSDQWFELPRQDEIAVDKRIYTSFDPKMKPVMKQETIEFMSVLVRENLSIINLIDSDFMVLNEAMAKYYGIKGVKGDHFRSVKRNGAKADRIRGGILTHAGILMQGGTGDRTSIIERGAFIARKIINKPPSDPPPDAGELPLTSEQAAKMTAAQLVRFHASSLSCANCHSQIDPLGMGLESFDAVGLFRTEEVRLNPLLSQLGEKQQRRSRNWVISLPIDTKGFLYDGQKFNGVDAMKKVLLSKKDDLAKGYIKALLSYVNGREANLTDEAIVEDIMKNTKESNYPARSIIEEILKSDIMFTY